MTTPGVYDSRDEVLQALRGGLVRGGLMAHVEDLPTMTTDAIDEMLDQLRKHESEAARIRATLRDLHTKLGAAVTAEEGQPKRRRSGGRRRRGTGLPEIAAGAATTN